MSAAHASFVILIFGACAAKPAQRNPLPPAGDFLDDGSGWLAKLSASARVLAQNQEPSSSGVNQQPPEGDFDVQEVDEPWQTARISNQSSTSTANAYQLPSTERSARPRSYRIVDQPGQIVYGQFSWRGRPPTNLVACDGKNVIADTRPLAGVVVELRQPALVNEDVLRSFQDLQSRGVSVTLSPCGWLPTVSVLQREGTLRVSSGNQSSPVSVTMTGLQAAPVSQTLAMNDSVIVTAGIGTTTISGHSRLPAFVRGLESPLFAVTDERGGFQIANVIPGEYELVVWHAPVMRSADKLHWGDSLQTVQRVVLPIAKGGKLQISLASP